MMGPVQNEDPIYRAMVAAFTADKRNRVIPSYGIRKKRIDLDVALVQQEFKLVGDFVYVDYNSTGTAECSLNNTSEDAFPLIALAGVQNIPYDGLYITAAAQPGLFINLWYGYNSQFISPTSAIATIGSITNPVKIDDSLGNDINSASLFQALTTSLRYLLTQDGGFSYGAAYASTTTTAANTPANVVAAASNLNGMAVHRVSAQVGSGAGNSGSFLCKATAPASMIDGDVLDNYLFSGAAIATHAMNSPAGRTVRVASGKRLDRISASGETSVLATALYTLF